MARLFDFFLLVLDRTGAAGRIAALPIFPAQMPLAARAAWIVALLGSAVLLVYAALAAGNDPRVRAFRVGTLLLGALLPLLAARFVPAGAGRPFGGAVLAVTFAAGFLHRALAARRKEGVASRALTTARLTLELAGIALSLLAAGLYAMERRVPLRIAFWGLLCLRLSIADLLYPSRLTRDTGLVPSASKDLKAARRRGRAARRVRRALAGTVKLLVAAVWIGMPLLAVLAPAEVASGAWPRGAILLTLYPAAALGLTGLLLLAGAVRRLPSAPFDAARGAVVGAGTLLWLAFVFGRLPVSAPAASVTALFAIETLAGFLFGAASRGR